MEDHAEAWFRRRASHWRDWPPEQLLRWKHSQGIRISVVIPARDEEATAGSVAGAIRDAFMTGEPLVDELVVMDSGSTDRTAEAAARAGATVHRCLRWRKPWAHPGKGEALWKSHHPFGVRKRIPNVPWRLFAARSAALCSGASAPSSTPRWRRYRDDDRR